MTDTTITVHYPSGVQVIPRGEVRWFDRNADELTDGYFKLHLNDELLDPRWEAWREGYKKGQETLLPIPGMIKPRLVALPYKHEWRGAALSMRYPIGWNVIEPKGDAGFSLMVCSPVSDCRNSSRSGQ